LPLQRLKSPNLAFSGEWQKMKNAAVRKQIGASRIDGGSNFQITLF